MFLAKINKMFLIIIKIPEKPGWYILSFQIYFLNSGRSIEFMMDGRNPPLLENTGN